MKGLEVIETDGKTTSIEWKTIDCRRKYKSKRKRDVGRPMKRWD
jgi:hypothetical protein